MARQHILKMAVQADINTATNDVMVKNEPCIERAAEHNFTRCGLRIELCAIRSFKADAWHMQGHHDRAIVQQHHILIKERTIGQPATCKNLFFAQRFKLPDCAGKQTHNA